jgi:hypothetical protein
MHKTTIRFLSMVGFVAAFLLAKMALAGSRDVAQPQPGTDYVVLEESATTVKVRLLPDVNFTEKGVEFFAKTYGTTPFKIREAEQRNTLPLCRRDGDGARAPQVPPALRSSDAFWVSSNDASDFS